MEEPTNEIERMALAKSIYLETGALEPVFEPPEWVEPEEPERVSFFQAFGLEAYSMMLAVAGAVLISAFTGSLILFISAVNTEALLLNIDNVPPFIKGIIDFAPSLFFVGGAAFELYFFAHGVAEGRKSSKMIFQPWALVAAGAVMFSAGILRAFALLPDPSPFWEFVYWLVLAIVIISTGIGAPTVAYFGAYNIGVFINQYEEKQRQLKPEFEKYRAGLRAEWQELYDQMYEDFEKRSAKFQKQFLKWDELNAPLIFGVERSDMTRKRTQSGPKPVSEKRPSVQSQVEQWLNEKSVTAHDIGTEPGHIFTPMHITEELQILDGEGKLDSTAVRTALSRLRK